MPKNKNCNNCAYAAGRAYALAKKGKRVPNKTASDRKAFRAGVNSVRGGK